MKNIALLFLLLIGQVVSAQSDSIDTIALDENEFEHWSARRGTDVMFDEVALKIKMTAEVDFDIEVEVEVEVEVEEDVRDKLRSRQRELGLNGEYEIDIE